MEIKRNKIEKLLELFRNSKENNFNLKTAETETGEEIPYTIIGNRDGWYAVVCFYSDGERVDVYDRHVFDRYKLRYLKTNDPKEIIVKKFLYKNGSGILFIEGPRFSKRIRDGACFGSITSDDMIIYHKTFVCEDQLDQTSQYNLLNGIKYLDNVDNRREGIQS